MEPKYHGRMEPVYPCQIQLTRHCPAVLEATCADKNLPCARFDKWDDEAEVLKLWQAEFPDLIIGPPKVG